MHLIVRGASLKRRYAAADLFQGIGGGTLGLQNAGFKVVAALDFDAFACETYKNNTGLEPITTDINEISGEQILEHYGLQKGSIDLVVGCPPCQGFSSLRRTTYPPEEDARKHLVKTFFEKTEQIAPKAILFENVPGILLEPNKQYFDRYLEKLEKKGYKTSWGIFDAVDYGVPQHRKRVISISILGISEKPELPQPTHTKKDSRKPLKSWRTVRETIKDLPALQPGESDLNDPNHKARKHSSKTMNLITNIPKDGGSRKELPDHLWLPCHKRLEGGEGAGNIYGRLWWDKPSSTLTCRCTSPSCGRYIHPEQDRAITPREAGLLQSFPKTFKFPINIGLAEKQIGNAVPPDLLTAFAWVIRDYL